jgi:predicted MPP superfamily phosphohydrolase
VVSRPLTRTVASLAAIGAGCVAYGTFIERRWYRLQRLRLPGVLRRDGVLRVLHVSDVHLVPGQAHRVTFLRELGELDHDLVVATGDLLGAEDAEVAAADALAPLTSRDRPGLVVLGSNDLYGPMLKNPFGYLFPPRHEREPHYGPRLDTDGLIAALADRGYRTLIDEAGSVDTVAGVVAVGGMHDPHLGGPRAAAATVAPPAGTAAVLHLGLVHAPYLAALDVLVDAGHDLLLAGHTHGGQVRLPSQAHWVTASNPT